MLLFRQPCVQFSLQATRPLKDYPRNTFVQKEFRVFGFRIFCEHLLVNTLNNFENVTSEKYALQSSMWDGHCEDREAEIQRLNDKHDKEMRAIRENMEKEKVTFGCGGTGLTARATTARKRDEKIRQTYEDQEEVEKPGFFRKALQFVGHIAPAVGAVVSAVAPTLAPIPGAVATYGCNCCGRILKHHVNKIYLVCVLLAFTKTLR